MDLHLTPLSTLIIGLIAGLGSSYLCQRIAAWRGSSTTSDKSRLLSKHPRANHKLDLNLLRINQSLRHASEPRQKGISGTC